MADQRSINRSLITPDIKADLSLDALQRLGTADGAYKVLAIDFVGDTRGSEWYADVTCLGISGTPPESQVNAGRGAEVSLTP